MIITFHTIFSICLSVIEKYKRKEKWISYSQSINKDLEHDLTFDPPVYKQRYGAVHNILMDNPWKSSIKKIVDFGCAEFQLFPFVKWFLRINEVLEVDIDRDLLIDHLYRLRPLTSDYLSSRPEPLTVSVYQGSISDPDDCLVGTDAVIGIELIEHLYPDDLDALPYNVFGFIKPKIAIFTTPNEDFNVLFPNFKGVRHADHKFEWNREQFQSWATNITTRFPDYSVTFEGIGEGPSGTEYLGCCSQMAVFVKSSVTNTTEQSSDKTSFGVCRFNCYSNLVYTTNGSNGSYYSLIDTIEYPGNKDDRTIEQKILDELQYGIRLRSNINGRFYNETSNRFEIPITELIYNYRTNIATELEAREILENANYKIEQCTIYEQIEICVVHEPEMDESGSSTPLTSPTITDSQLDDTNSDWDPFSITDDDPWNTGSNYQKHELSSTPPDSSQAAREIVDNLINNLNLSEDKSIVSNGINLFIANDVQALIPLHEHERMLKRNLKSQPGLSEAGPSYAKKRKKKLHDDDNESLMDVFKNAEIENKLRDETKIVEINDSDVEDLQNVPLDKEDTSDAIDLEVEVASREALFDPNSVIELADLDELVNDEDNVAGQPNLILIGFNIDPDEHQLDAPILPANADPFPNWLLHMLGAEVVLEDMPHDEPHFYCQGDGVVVGVHPSFIEGEFEEDHSSSGSDSSSNESSDSVTVSNDAAEAEPTVSEVEVISLPDDGASEATVEPVVVNVQQPVPPSGSGSVATSDEYYDTVDSVSTNRSQKGESTNATTSAKE